ncbi:MAG: phosphoglycolate phosphatase [Pseudomonadota bacterium]
MTWAAVFDLDGTLIDSLPNVQAAANAVLGESGLPALSAKVVAGFVGRGEGVFVDRLIGATALDRDQRASVMERFIHHYKIEAQKTVTFPGVRAALNELKGQGVPMGLVTNKPRAPLGPTLTAANLDDMFDVVIAGDDLPQRKPDPEPLLQAIRLLGATAGVYVGDSEVDAATAKAANIPFVLFTEGIRQTPVEDMAFAARFDRFENLGACLAGLRS